jgi:hypothetical protein
LAWKKRGQREPKGVERATKSKRRRLGFGVENRKTQKKEGFFVKEK